MQKTSAPTLSILIPTYGKVDLAKAAIMSVLRHIDSIDQVIIIDDNPSEPLAHTFPEIYSLNQKISYHSNAINLGRVKTYNKLLELCSSDFFLMLDGDDLLSEFVSFNEIKKVLLKNPDISVFCGRVTEIHGKNVIKESGPTPTGIHPSHIFFRRWIGVDGLFPHNGCIMNRRIAIAFGGYYPNIINADIALIRKMLTVGVTVASDLHVAYWRFHGNNTSKVTITKDILDNFQAVTAPFEEIKKSRLAALNIWFILNTRSFLNSSQHLIMTRWKGNTSIHIYKFIYMFLLQYKKFGYPIILGIALFLPKSLFILALRALMGPQRYNDFMARRGNYIYFNLINR